MHRDEVIAMNKQPAPLYLARPNSSRRPDEIANGGPDDATYTPSPAQPETKITSEEAAIYIAELLTSLRAIAIKAQLGILSDLIEVAQEEARFHCRL